MSHDFAIENGRFHCLTEDVDANECSDDNRCSNECICNKDVYEFTFVIQGEGTDLELALDNAEASLKSDGLGDPSHAMIIYKPGLGAGRWEA
jgi:hypothetical protein